MPPSNFNNIVKNYRNLYPATIRLQGLENHVWRAINARRYDQPRNRLEEFLMQAFAPSHQWTAVTTALAIGVFAAYFSTPNMQPIQTTQALRLDVFEANYASPLNVLMKEKS